MSEPDENAEPAGDRRRGRGRLGRSGREIVGAQVAQAASAAAVLVAVFWTGGVGQEALAAICGLGVVAWLGAAQVRPARPSANPFAWLWWGLGLWSLLALVPLPRAMVGWLHPMALSVSDASRATLGLEPLALLPVAIVPAEAAFQAALALIAGSIAMTAGIGIGDESGRRVAERAQLALLLLPLAVGAVWVAAWHPWAARVVPHGMRELLRNFAPVNQNHIAALLSLGLGLSMASWLSAPDPTHQRLGPVLALGHGLLLALVPSRAGLLGMFFIATLAWARKPALRRNLRLEAHVRARQARRDQALKVGVALSLIAVVALPAIEAEFGPMFRSPYPDGKLSALRVVAAHAFDGWAIGQGAGSLAVTLLATEPAVDARLEFAENIVLERLVAHGIPVALVFLAVLGVLLVTMVTRWRRLAATNALGVAAASVVFHDMADFSLEIAGVLMPFMALGVLADRQRDQGWISNGRALGLDRRPALLLASAVGLALGGAVLLGIWNTRPEHIALRMDNQPVEQARVVVERIYPYAHHAFYRLGRAQVDAGQLEQAERSFDRALALRPGSTHAWRWRIHLRRQLGQPVADDLVALARRNFSEGRLAAMGLLDDLAALERALPVLVQHPPLCNFLAERAYERQPKAVWAIVTALRTAYPQRRFDAEQTLGRQYVDAGMIPQARWLAGVLLGEPETELAGYLLLGRIHGHEKRYLEAFTMHAEVCRRSEDPDSCRAPVRYAHLIGRPAEAVSYIRGLLSRFQSTPARLSFYWAELGWAYFAAGAPDDAVAAARRAIGYDRDNVRARELAVKAALGVGNFRHAEAELEALQAAHADPKLTVRLAEEVSQARRPQLMRDEAELP